MRDDLESLFEEARHGLAGAVRGVLGPGGDVQDILQESFLRAWKARAEGRVGRDPKAWIFVITLNTARDALRRGRIRRASPLEESGAMNVNAIERSPDRTLQDAEALQDARAAIHDLAEEEREVFLMRVSGELTFDAIGEALGITTSTAKNRMRKALDFLRIALAAHAPAVDRRSS